MPGSSFPGRNHVPERIQGGEPLFGIGRPGRVVTGHHSARDAGAKTAMVAGPF